MRGGRYGGLVRALIGTRRPFQDGCGCMADAERLLRRVRVTLVIRMTLDPHGSLVKGEVIRVPHHSGPEFRTWSQFLELARQEATRELPGIDLADPPAP